MIVDPKTLLDKHLFEYKRENVQPNSYDLRLHKVFEIRGGIRFFANGEKQLPPYQEVHPTEGLFGYPNPSPPEPWFILRKGVLYQLEFYETVSMPSHLAAISVMRSSMSKSGASGEPGLYDSGYIGQCGMTVSVDYQCEIQQGASVAQLIFMTANTSQLYEGEYLDSRWSQRLLDKEA